jgi:hypothetical protein
MIDTGGYSEHNQRAEGPPPRRMELSSVELPCLASIVLSRKVSPVSLQYRRCSIGLVVLASPRLSPQRLGGCGSAAVVWWRRSSGRESCAGRRPRPGDTGALRSVRAFDQCTAPSMYVLFPESLDRAPRRGVAALGPWGPGALGAWFWDQPVGSWVECWVVSPAGFTSRKGAS